MNDVTTAPTEPPMMNDPAARTPDGTILDQSAPTTPPTEGTPNEQAPAETKPEPSTDAPAIPEAYEFKAPDGYTVDKALVDAVTPAFKDLGLTQEQAQKLFDIQAAHQIELAKKIDTAVADTRKQWEDQTKADPEMGPNLDRVKTDVGRMWSALGNEPWVEKMKEALNWSGMGDNPDMIRGLWKIAQRVNEGTPVNGGGPSPHGQQPSGVARRPSPAQAMYPSLRS